MIPGNPTGLPDVVFCILLLFVLKYPKGRTDEDMAAQAHVLIEGQYYYLIMRHFYAKPFPPINLYEFAINLAREQGLWCDQVFYYIAPPYQSPTPTQKEMDMRAGYDKAISALKRMKNFNVREGRCQRLKNDDTGEYEYHEKGVDSLIIMDLYKAVGVVKNLILLSCDTDLVPILKEVRDNGKLNTILYYYSDRQRHSKFSMSNEIITATSKSALITKEHFEKSIRKKENQEKEI